MKVTEALIDAYEKLEALEVSVKLIEVSIATYRQIHLESGSGVSSGVSEPKPGEPPKFMGQVFGIDLWARPDKATPAQKAAADIRAEISKDFMDEHVHKALSLIADHLEKQ
jgi:hypothetical protein